MECITHKKTVQQFLERLPSEYTERTKISFLTQLQDEILAKKVRFPLLEYTGKSFHKKIPVEQQPGFLDALVSTHQTGAFVIAGIMLQSQLSSHYEQSLRQAENYILRGNTWYVCDIIGERVMGYALLTSPEKTIPILESYKNHPDKWMVRCIGVAAHYAIKKGLVKNAVKQVFALLLSLAGTTEFHTRKGIGWAAKTTAKFHPDIIAQYQAQMTGNPSVNIWFHTKIRIGLSRSAKYAGTYPG